VDGRYRVEAVLGRGALGVTFAVRDEAAGAAGGEGPELALKATRLRGRGAGGWKAFDLAEREAAALRSLSGHPNIPRFERFFDVDRPDDRVRCLVQQRVRGGGPLSAVVASGQRASPAEVARMARDVLRALSHLASRSPPVTHRDVKPENVVLEGRRWGGGKAFLVDFSGVAAAALAASEGGGGGGVGGSSSASSSPGTTVIGTFGFMAPVGFFFLSVLECLREFERGRGTERKELTSPFHNKNSTRNNSAAPRARPRTSTPSARPCSSR
jgi:serine/threonine protein kinase